MVTLFASWTLTTHHDESLIKLPVSPIGYNCEDTIAPSFRQATVAEVVRSWWGRGGSEGRWFWWGGVGRRACGPGGVGMAQVTSEKFRLLERDLLQQENNDLKARLKTLTFRNMELHAVAGAEMAFATVGLSPEYER